MRTSIKILITIFCFIILVGGGAITFSILSKPPSLCSNFNCPTGTERDLSKVKGNTKEECCKAIPAPPPPPPPPAPAPAPPPAPPPPPPPGSCADFTCKFPQIKKDPPGPGFSHKECCTVNAQMCNPFEKITCPGAENGSELTCDEWQACRKKNGNPAPCSDDGYFLKCDQTEEEAAEKAAEQAAEQAAEEQECGAGMVLTNGECEVDPRANKK